MSSLTANNSQQVRQNANFSAQLSPGIRNSSAEGVESGDDDDGDDDDHSIAFQPPAIQDLLSTTSAAANKLC